MITVVVLPQLTCPKVETMAVVLDMVAEEGTVVAHHTEIQVDTVAEVEAMMVTMKEEILVVRILDYIM